MNLADRTEAVFRSPAFSAGLKGGGIRESQIAMARAAAGVAQYSGTAVLEAGTGVGKSLAYLVPALLSGELTVISTATIALQDQLMGQDIPAACRILGKTPDAAVLKGRSNYLCLRKWFLAGQESSASLERWMEKSSGDLSAGNPGISSPLLNKVRGDALDCVGSRCPEMHRCFYYRARKAAGRASILVVNHHLLLCGLRSGDLIPEAWMLVADEAHSLKEAASSTLGHMLSASMLNGVFDEISMGPLPVKRKTELLAAARYIGDLVAETAASGDGGGFPDPDLIMDNLQRIADASGDMKQDTADSQDLAGSCQILAALEKTALAIAEADASSWCTYVSEAGRDKVLRCVPLNPGGILAETLYSSFPGVILTSATLTSGGSFSYSRSMLGIPEEAQTEVFPSPFDYRNNAVLCVPEDTPACNDHEAVARAAWRTASRAGSILGGRTMVLFTSYRNMELCEKAFRSDPDLDLELLVQGKMNRTDILKKFRCDPRAVILGTASFWEGVDLPGSILQALVIDRIPFPSPGNPLVKARMDSMERDGASSFTGLMIPEAVTRLRQGTGRLLRSGTDRGAVFILDSRLRTAGYRGILLRSLPDFRRCSLEEAMDFLREQAMQT